MPLSRSASKVLASLPTEACLLVRELDERLGFGELIVQHLTDSRGRFRKLGFIQYNGEL
jgi:hypothetical protein